MASLPFQYTCTRSPAQLFRSPLPSHNRPRGRRNQHANRLKCCNKTTRISISEPSRRTANYPPTIWDNSYIQTLRSEDRMEDEQAKEMRKLKEEVKRLLIVNNSEELLDQIEHIDTLQQLGVAYHFQDEIKNILATIFCSLKKTNLITIHNDDIHATALLFRLLRANGFHVSTNIFDKFREEGGAFKNCLKNDAKGMLSLYEASFLAVEGEKELDEARLFATECLRQYLMDSSSSISESLLKERIAHAMDLPLHWRMPRLHARWFIDLYQKDKDNMNPTFLRLAKLDFNFLQNIYKRELKELSRWDVNAAEQLPDYMKICFLALFNTINDIVYKMLNSKGVYIMPQLKRAVD